MTRDEILAMEPGHEMDALVAKHVTHCTYLFHETYPSYSTDIAAAWEVVEKMDKNHYHPSVDNSLPWYAYFHERCSPYRHFGAKSKHRPPRHLPRRLVSYDRGVRIMQYVIRFFVLLVIPLLGWGSVRAAPDNPPGAWLDTPVKTRTTEPPTETPVPTGTPWDTSTPWPTATYATPTSPPPETPPPTAGETPVGEPLPLRVRGEAPPWKCRLIQVHQRRLHLAALTGRTSRTPTWDCFDNWDERYCLAQTGGGMPPNVALGLIAIGTVVCVFVILLARAGRRVER